MMVMDLKRILNLCHGFSVCDLHIVTYLGGDAQGWHMKVEHCLLGRYLWWCVTLATSGYLLRIKATSVFNFGIDSGLTCCLTVVHDICSLIWCCLVLHVSKLLCVIVVVIVLLVGHPYSLVLHKFEIGALQVCRWAVGGWFLVLRMCRGYSYDKVAFVEDLICFQDLLCPIVGIAIYSIWFDLLCWRCLALVSYYYSVQAISLCVAVCLWVALIGAPVGAMFRFDAVCYVVLIYYCLFVVVRYARSTVVFDECEFNNLLVVYAYGWVLQVSVGIVYKPYESWMLVNYGVMWRVCLMLVGHAFEVAS
eukprot:gene3120-2102_t